MADRLTEGTGGLVGAEVWARVCPCVRERATQAELSRSGVQLLCASGSGELTERVGECVRNGGDKGRTDWHCIGEPAASTRAWLRSPRSPFGRAASWSEPRVGGCLLSPLCVHPAP